MSVVWNYMDLNSAAGKVSYLLCKMQQRLQKHVSCSLMREPLKTNTSNCYVFFCVALGHCHSHHITRTPV